jgi:hypothetical protein
VKEPNTWTLPHLLQLKQEYKKLVEDFNCDIQEFITVQDPPALPSNILHLPPLTSLHSATVRNMELPHPGEQRKVQPPSQRTLSRQLMRTCPLWKTNIVTGSNTRMLEQLGLRTPMSIHTTIERDLNPRPCSVNDDPSVLAHEMMTIDPGENPTNMLSWKPTTFVSHIHPRSHDDHFPIHLWETWFCQSLGVPISTLLANPRQCPCRQFNFDPYGDHIQTCQRQSAVLPTHKWIVYKLSLLLRSVGHRVEPIK